MTHLTHETKEATNSKAGFFNGGDIAPQGAIRGDLNNLKNWGAILNNWGAISQLQILL